jgi:hypothetical protein
MLEFIQHTDTICVLRDRKSCVCVMTTNPPSIGRFMQRDVTSQELRQIADKLDELNNEETTCQK